MTSDSDDDDLLSAPTFKKNGRKNAEERQMLSFLDLQCKKEDEHFDRRERINEKIKQEEEELNKSTISIPVIGLIPSSTSLAPGDHGENSSVVSKSPDEMKESMIKLRSKFDDDDPNYWIRIGERVKNAEGNRMEREKRQREIHQNIHGYNSDDDHASSGRINNRAIKDATISGASVVLGTRHLIFSEARRSTVHRATFPALSECCSGTEAIQNLRRILNDIDIDAPRSWSSETKEIWSKSHKFFLQNYKSHLDSGLLEYILQGHGRTCWKSTPLVIHDKLMSWLIETSCTCEQRSLQSSALAAAISFMDNNIKILKYPNDTNVESNHSMALPLFQLSDIGPFFQGVFGLWTATEPPPIIFVSCRVLGLMMDDRNKISRLNAALKLWATAFRNNLVTWDFPGHDAVMMDSDVVLKPIATFVEVIVRLGLDPCFHSGASLNESRVQLLQSFFSWLSKQLTSCSDSCIQHILQYAAKHALSACSNLPDFCYNKEEDIEEGDEDRDGWLPISLTLRSYHFPFIHDSSLVIQFYGHYSISAIHKSCHEISDWDARIFTVVSELMDAPTLENIPLSLRCIACSRIALSMMTDRMPSTGDPRYHCVLELSALCTQIGLDLLQRNVEADASGKRTLYGSGEEADRFRSFYETMENLCDSQKKRITSVFSSPHFRRAKEYLSILEGAYRAFKEDALCFVKRRRVQSEISQFMTNKGI